jgi:hypothetical protein
MSGVDDLIANITESQNAEQELIARLDTLVNQPGFNVNSSGVQTVINAINTLSSARVQMFNSLNTQAKTLQEGVSNSRVDLVSQMTLLNVVEDQLTQATNAINQLQGQNDTKRRMVEVNTYYGQRYEAQSKLMQIIIFICAPLLILFILKKKGLLPPMISNYAIGITIAVGIIFVIRSMWDIYTRSNMNYDEYDWDYEDPTQQSPTKWEYNKANAFNFDNPIKTLLGNLGLCVGSNCCANGMFFDKSKQQCSLVNPGGKGTSVTETFVCGSKLQGTNLVPIDEDEEKQNGISPFTNSSNFMSL